MKGEKVEVEFFNKNLELTIPELQLKVVVYYHNLQTLNSMWVTYEKIALFIV